MTKRSKLFPATPFLLSFALLLSFAWSPLFAQTSPVVVVPFEGTITYGVTTPAMGTDKSEMRCNIKGNKTFTEIDMGAMGTQKLYIDQDKKKVLSVVEAMKVGYEVDIPNDTTSRMTDFKATGKTKTINGYNAQEFTGSMKNMMFDIWASPDLPPAVKAALQQTMRNNAQNAGSNGFGQLEALGLAPVSMTVVMNGNTMATMELEKFEQKSLSDALFVPASNIKITHLTPEQVKQMQSGGGGGMN